jgi:hypothetical protein
MVAARHVYGTDDRSGGSEPQSRIASVSALP